MELTATEQLERARKSIELAEERVKVIDQRLPELENELEDLILKNEIKGYKGRTIEKTQAEIDNLQKEKATLERTVEVLKKKLPEFERQTRIEVTEQDTVRDYRKAHSGLIELLKGIPSLDGLKAEIQKIQSYREGLEQSQGRYFDLLTVCNDFLIKENLQAVGNVDIETLISDKDSIDYQDLLILSDSLIDINEMINDLQYKLFKVGIAQVPIKEIQPEPVPEYSPCGNYYRICEHGTWTLFEKQYKPGKYGGYEEIWMPGDSGKIKPEFPTKAEFSEDGRFRIEKGVSRWFLFQKNEEGHWQKIKEERERENLDFPTKLVAVPREEKKAESAVGQMAYGNENKNRDPDKAFNQ